MFDSELGVETSDILTVDRWHVVPLELTPAKLAWLWDSMNRYKTLFSDLTRGDANNFFNLVSLPDSLWLEVRDDNETAGVVYWTGMGKMIDCDVHLMFFDRKLEEKVELCKRIAKWFFQNFPQFVRMTAQMPHIYFATVRLAKNIGFRFEGKKRQSQLIGGKYVDEVILGLLAEELS